MSRLETSGLLAVRSGFLARAFSLPSVTLSALDFCAPARAGQTSDYSGSEHFPQSTLERLRTRSTSSTPVRQGSRSGEFQPDPNVAAPARGRAMAPGVAGLPNGATRSRRRRYSASSRSRFHTHAAALHSRPIHPRGSHPLDPCVLRAPGDASCVRRQSEHPGNQACGGSPAEAPLGLAGPRSPSATICGRAIVPPPDGRFPRLESTCAAAFWPRLQGPPADSARAGQSGKTPDLRPSSDSARACAAKVRANRPHGAGRETFLQIPCRSPCPRTPRTIPGCTSDYPTQNRTAREGSFLPSPKTTPPPRRCRARFPIRDRRYRPATRSR